jgi:2-keto-4-pentenoate hydratase/2-oxohepta-3-ene-1,7-dioic acid hydratase in catechol pathway
VGVRSGDGVVDLATASPGLPRDLRALLAAGPQALEQARRDAAAAASEAVRDAGTLHYLPPILGPSKILCMGLNYADHAAEGGHSKPDYPAFFMRGPSSLVGHGQALVVPRICDRLDYEGELAIIVGRRARHLTADQALDAVAGYAPFNDGSVRPYQRKSTQWTIGKNFDATGGFGPELVTADEVPPGAAGLSIRTRLNDEVMQDGNTGDMLFDVATTLVLLSECMTLEPGDVIITGTPAGVGYARDPAVWLKPGDHCEVEIEGIGTLSNPIAAES